MAWSLWFFAATMLLYLLQRFPLTGVFLMIVGAAFWSILLINLGVIGIGSEAVTGKVSRLWLIVPALYFGGYYWLYPATNCARNMRSSTRASRCRSTRTQDLVLGDRHR